MKLEYIASALNFVWLGGLETKYTPEVAAEISRVTHLINTWDDDHKYGVLFNAYAEPRMGKIMNDFFSPHTIQGDSGGLQMITLGHTPTPELRKKVYEIQAKHCTHGMCFDEIPIKSTGRTELINHGSRLYDKSMVPECAKQTALNIIEQVETFDKLNSDCKVFMIIQGNCLETYQYWVDETLKHMPKDIIGKLHGIASGGGCLGNDFLEDVERYFTLSHIEAPDNLKQNFHLLGVGSPNRIVTLARMNHLFDKDVNISYDSTKHTGGITRAQLQLGHRIVSIGSRQRNHIYMDIVNKFLAFQGILGYDFVENDLYEVLLMTAVERYAKYGEPETNLEYTFKTNILRYALLSFSIRNMFDVISHAQRGEFVKTGHKEANLSTLSMINSVSDFNAWKREFGSRMDSKRVVSTETMGSCLSEFF